MRPSPHILRTTLLRHDLPDGSWHIDWLIERSREEAQLLTFRLEANPLTVAAWPIKGERIPDHRRLYLDYEGPISGGRGNVRCVARGFVEPMGDQLWTWKAEISTLCGVIRVEPGPTPASVLAHFAQDQVDFSKRV